MQMIVQGSRKQRLQSMSRTLHALSTWPQLYIYSTSDHVIPYNGIKLWVQVRPCSACLLLGAAGRPWQWRM